MDPITIVAATRTLLGAFNGKFKSTSAVELGAVAIKKIIENIDTKIDSVYMGCVLPAGLGQSPARQASICLAFIFALKNIF